MTSACQRADACSFASDDWACVALVLHGVCRGGGGHLPAFVVPMVAACFDLVVHCRRRPGRPREVEEIRAVGTRGENGVIEASPLFHRVDGDLITGGSEVPAPEKCALAGVCTEQVRECQSRDHDDGSGR